MLPNDRSPTFYGQQGASGVLALTLASPNVNVCCSLGVDTRESDDLTILHIPQFRKVPRQVHHVARCDLFRWLLKKSSTSEEVIGVVPHCMAEATVELYLPISLPTPNSKFFRHRAACRRFQHCARGAGMAYHWQDYRRLLVILPCDIHQLQRGQRRQVCSSLVAESFIAK